MLVAATAALVAACSSSGDRAVEVLPIEDIVAGEIVVEPDASGRSATVAVDTTIPVACAVVYGTDEGFGSIATDADMQGGAHTDHTPLLTGLEPATAYRFVLQGSDADGNLYRSEVMTFTTPQASEQAAPGTEVAATVVGASSAFSDDFAPELAVDGDPATAWATDGDGDDAWIELDLGGPTDLVGARIRSRSMGDGSSVIERFTVTVDGGAPLGPFDAGVEGPVAEFDATGRVVRIDAVETTGGNVGAVEIELFAAG